MQHQQQMKMAGKKGKGKKKVQKGARPKSAGRPKKNEYMQPQQQVTTNIVGQYVQNQVIDEEDDGENMNEQHNQIPQD